MRFLKFFIPLFFTSLAFGQVGLMPTAKQQFLDASGRPLSGGKLYTYEAGTLNPLSTFTDASGSVANTNPVVLDAGGFANVWLTQGHGYHLILKTSMDVTVWTEDDIFAGSLPGGGVTSVFGRTGTVIAQTGDYTAAQITNAASLTGNNIFSGGSNDFSGSTHTIPTKVASITTRPTACTRGELFFAFDATAGLNLSGCTTTGNPGTWTLMGGGSGGGLPTAGGTMTGDILVSPTDTVSFGSNSAEAKKIWVKDINISGTCSGAGCGGGGSFLPITGGTMTGNIAASVGNSYFLGSAATPWGVVFAKTAVGTGSVHVYDAAAADLTGNFFHIEGDFQGGAASIMRFIDTSNNNMLQLTRRFASTNIDVARFDMDVSPLTDNTRDLGGTFPAPGQAAWRDIYYKGRLIQNGATVIDASQNATVNNLTITGTCSGCPGSGGGSFLPIAGGTMTGPIGFSTVGTFDIGSTSHPAGTVYGEVALGTKKLQVYDSSVSDFTGGVFWSQVATISNGTLITLDTKDNAGNVMVELARTFGSVNTDLARFDASLMPITDNARDLGGTLGAPGQAAWRDVYFKGSLKQGATVRLDASGNAVVNNLTVGGTCTGCSGSGAFLPLSGGTMAGPIGFSALFDIGGPGARVGTVYTTNLNVSGTCTGCGGGSGAVTSVTGVSLIQASPTTGAVSVSCPNCAGLTFANNFSGFNTFINSTSFSGAIQFGPGLGSNLNTAGGANFQNTVTIAGGLNANGGAVVQGGNLLVLGSGGTGAIAAGSSISTSTVFAAQGHPGITGSTCSHWTGGICDTP